MRPRVLLPAALTLLCLAPALQAGDGPTDPTVAARRTTLADRVEALAPILDPATAFRLRDEVAAIRNGDDLGRVTMRVAVAFATASRPADQPLYPSLGALERPDLVDGGPAIAGPVLRIPFSQRRNGGYSVTRGIWLPSPDSD